MTTLKKKDSSEVPGRDLFRSKKGMCLPATSWDLVKFVVAIDQNGDEIGDGDDCANGIVLPT